MNEIGIKCLLLLFLMVKSVYSYPFLQFEGVEFYRTKLDHDNISVYNFLVKALAMCHKGNSPLTQDLSSYLNYYSAHVYHVWHNMTTLRVFSPNEGPHWLLSPMFSGQFRNDEDRDTAIHILTYSTLQLNLTFLHFDLKRSFYGCKYHQVEVRQWF